MNPTEETTEELISAEAMERLVLISPEHAIDSPTDTDQKYQLLGEYFPEDGADDE